MIRLKEHERSTKHYWLDAPFAAANLLSNKHLPVQKLGRAPNSVETEVAAPIGRLTTSVVDAEEGKPTPFQFLIVFVKKKVIHSDRLKSDPLPSMSVTF